MVKLTATRPRWVIGQVKAFVLHFVQQRYTKRYHSISSESKAMANNEFHVSRERGMLRICDLISAEIAAEEPLHDRQTGLFDDPTSPNVSGDSLLSYNSENEKIRGGIFEGTNFSRHRVWVEDWSESRSQGSRREVAAKSKGSVKEA